tara:strand:- start:982 stop:1377 length:396 start_codon:yes stop_codon:yes gene_type:complete
MHLPEELIKELYNFNPFIKPINKVTREFLQNKRNISANKIQKWYKQNKIESKMPILFLDEMQNFKKWYIIRLYMKFYPKDDLRDWPTHCIKRKLNLFNKPLPNKYRKLYSAFEVFKFMKNETKQDIIATGF